MQLIGRAVFGLLLKESKELRLPIKGMGFFIAVLTDSFNLKLLLLQPPSPQNAKLVSVCELHLGLKRCCIEDFVVLDDVTGLLQVCVVKVGGQRAVVFQQEPLKL